MFLIKNKEMENNTNINLLEILKDCPEGTKLYSPIFGKCNLLNVTLDRINVRRENGNDISFYKNGQYCHTGECLLFPSEECRDWSNFKKPFEEGDVIVSQNGNIVIYSHFEINSYGNKLVYYQCLLYPYGKIKIGNDYGIGYIEECRHATKEEKEKLYKALEKEGYKYDPITKNVEKIQKFDISTLKPFDKVLVRNESYHEWIIGFYSHLSSYFSKNTYFNKYVTNGGEWDMCIPYEGNEYLVGTTNEPNDFFVTWK